MSIVSIVRATTNADRWIKRVIQMLLDVVATCLALSFSTLLRLENLEFFYQKDFWLLFIATPVPTIFIFWRLGLYRVFLRYISISVAISLMVGSSAAGILLLMAVQLLALDMPLAIPFMFTMILYLIACGVRFTLRHYAQNILAGVREPVAVYGAGAAGSAIVQALKSNNHYQVCLIIDDDKHLQGGKIFGIEISAYDQAIVRMKKLGIRTVLLAMPSATFEEKHTIINRFSEETIVVKVPHDLSTLVDGQTGEAYPRNVEIEDLLGREPVRPIKELMSKQIFRQVVLVTGAGGSIGSELCKIIIEERPTILIAIDVSENAIYNLINSIEETAANNGVHFHAKIGSVADRSFVADVMEQFGVDVVFHAAAYKHVPLMEADPFQAFKNNAIGTMVLSEEAIKAKVKSFSLISTDKAVKPTNMMGASKRVAELICRSSNLSQKNTRFSVVRFGNVLGSSGSVVPLFKEQISSGGPVTLTHRDITRFFMTINEAVQLVVQSSALAEGGEVFVLDMGAPIKIIDLAKRMIEMAGCHPFIVGDECGKTNSIGIEITGLRPGEKLYEELSYTSTLQQTYHPRIMLSLEDCCRPESVKRLVSELDKAICTNDRTALVKLLESSANYSARF